MAKRTPREISEMLSEKPIRGLHSEVLKLRAIVRELETKSSEQPPIFKSQD
jgi:hypothetical protein